MKRVDEFRAFAGIVLVLWAVALLVNALDPEPIPGPGDGVSPVQPWVQAA